MVPGRALLSVGEREEGFGGQQQQQCIIHINRPAVRFGRGTRLAMGHQRRKREQASVIQERGGER
jgi:hypothetical protein